MSIIISDSHSGSRSAVSINGQDDCLLLKRRAAPKVKVGPRFASKLKLSFASTEMVIGTQVHTYGICDGAEVVVENAGEVLKNSPVPLYLRLKQNESLDVRPLDYANLNEWHRQKITKTTAWLSGICFLNDGLLICAIRPGDDSSEPKFWLVDSKVQPYTVKPIIMQDASADPSWTGVQVPDSVCLLGDGVLAVSTYQPGVGPLLYDWASEDWEANPVLSLHAASETPAAYDKMCGICEDLKGRVLCCDIMANRVVIFNRQLNAAGNVLQERLVEEAVVVGLNHPCGIAVLPDDSFGVTEWSLSRISIFSPEGAPRFKFSCPCQNPRAIAVDLNGSIVISDYSKGKVHVFQKLADNFDALGEDVSSHLPAPFSKALDLMESPMAVAINPENGHLFVASSANGTLVEICNQR